ncbi:MULTISPECIES: DUF4148 domain-containing protein [Pandoraea]|uniref:DUF4148 domain-containing protein n=1 Tax=Pandoraea capi TaxID=2508286 RepID=A0ABY6WC90_9BURK|nr:MULTISPECIES: DUF4148 domain-containing protein [Pandoraea]MCI3204579.1 hypothetical protein [Pandoraea sp. LA3]MDN4582607.1 hypothetical protein [Pandoraea capi]VVE55612.1 hypothetical protein PCA20602_05032 [Pandoraea capi]
MNRKLMVSALISATMAAAAGSAFAQSRLSSDAYPDGSPYAWVPQTSQLTRAQVREQLIEARAQGLIPQNDYDYPAFNTMPNANVPGKTRAQVYDELVRARQNGEMKYSNP